MLQPVSESDTPGDDDAAAQKLQEPTERPNGEESATTTSLDPTQQAEKEGSGGNGGGDELKSSNDKMTRLKRKRKRQLNTKRYVLSRAAEEQRMLDQVDVEIERVGRETELWKMKLEIAKIQATNAKLEQLKRFYELKKMERDLGISPEEGFEGNAKFDVT